MENAPKALLIAAAILVVMGLIALGVSIFWKADEKARIYGKKLTEEEVQLFNNQFLTFSGRTVYGSEVKNIDQKVHASNNKYKDEYGREVKIIKADGSPFNMNNVEYSKVYKITLIYDSSGLVDKIKIE